MPSRLVAVSQGGWEFPSTELRLGHLARGGWPLEIVSARKALPSDDEIEGIRAAGGDGATLILQRVLPDRDQVRRLSESFESVVFDFDDAIYAIPPTLEGTGLRNLARHAGRLLTRGYPRASPQRRRLIQLLGAVDASVAGNSILAAFARRHARRVAEIPTTVNPIAELPTDRDPTSLIWVGLGVNVRYLKLLGPALARLREQAEFTLTIVSSHTWEGAPVPIRFVQWSRETEREALLGAGVGLAPLPDDTWTQGKCGFRAILYGGHGVPAIASPVGITDRIVVDGETGLLASRTSEWVDAMRTLLRDPARADAMGRSAWQRIRARYSDELALRLWTNLLERG
jgi:hypothetical protein